ncbi:MAG: AAA family ATPase, partial [Rhodospirillaceae bacterium]
MEEQTGAALAPTGVAIRRLTLTNFRSYQRTRLDIDGRPVTLTGPNGAGKTNLLEALSFLAPGRGLRGAKLTDVGHAPVGDANEVGCSWAVAATLDTADGPIDLGTGFDAAEDGRRAVHINGQSVKTAGAFAQHLGLIWITPAMDRLFVDGPGARRRFIDRMITAFESDHAGRTAAYEQAYRQRLRLIRDGEGDPSWFAALEDTMARYGVALAAARHEFVARLNRELENTTGPFPTACLA